MNTSIYHFDYRAGLDASFKKDLWHTYFDFPLRPETYFYDDSVTTISIFISSKITKDIQQYFPNLKTIMCRSAGTDHVDLDFCKEQWIVVHSVPAYWAHVIATHAISLLLMGARKMFDTVRQIQEGKFFYDQDTLFDIKGKAVWILWTWRIGQEIAKQVHALGAHILATDLYPNNEFIASVSGKYVSQEELFRTVDILFLVCPATKENENLINVNTISLMKKGVYLINVARWNLVDEDALLTHAEHFGFIGLDTIKDETSQGLQKFAHKHNILITPHVAYLADSSLATIRETTYRLLAA